MTILPIETLKIRSILRRKKAEKKAGKKAEKKAGKKAEKKVLPKKSWPPQSVFSAWGSHKNKLPKVQAFQ